MTLLSEYTRWWQAVQNRDGRFDGVFIYGVRSTGIYCRPSCGARKPRVDQVTFFTTADEARAEGFRACRRCRPDEATGADLRTEMVRLSRFIESYDSPDRPLTLAVMADYMKLSPSHLQRSFRRIMGVSPREYAEMTRVKRLKALVRTGEVVTDAVYEAGYGSSSRVYESSDHRLGMTPGAYKKGGAGMRIRYTIVDCFLGRLLIGATERGISAVLMGRSDRELIAALVKEYPSAVIMRDLSGLGEHIRTLRDYLEGGKSIPDLPLDIRITAFQARVYEVLRRICRGSVRTYGQIAAEIGKPGAARAVGNACAANPTALVIPCHRVMRARGDLGGYRWGVERKRALLAMESQSRSEHDETFEGGAGI
jgi:AraC family transcriptional regulator, regulatory protein of adaptative response / methylated-DNA-[protein]-cysteine methyltransferase